MFSCRISHVAFRMSHLYHFSFFIYLFSFIIFSSCSSQKINDTEQITIAISKGAPADSYGAYGEWLLKNGSTIKWIDVYHMDLDSALILFDDCDGLLLSGGPDVFPERYGTEYDSNKCEYVDHRRDTLEFALIDKALEKNMPVLGICRGLQIFNVSQGGSLIVDIPSDFGSDIHRKGDGYACTHDVIVNKETFLYLICDTDTIEVNSSHHQGIERLADNLVISTFASDGLPEAIEWRDPENKSFFLAVQWHPERLEIDNPLSGPILKRFLSEVYKWNSIESDKTVK